MKIEIEVEDLRAVVALAKAQAENIEYQAELALKQDNPSNYSNIRTDKFFEILDRLESLLLNQDPYKYPRRK